MTAQGASGSEVPVNELSYTEASRELDAIVEFFEQREVDVDQLVSRLERATAIVDELDRRIRSTRMQVERLVPRLASMRESTDADAVPSDDNLDAEDPDDPKGGVGEGRRIDLVQDDEGLDDLV